MTEAFHIQPEPQPAEESAPELALVPDGPTEFELQLSRALAAGSDYITDYRVPIGQPPRRYLKPEAVARYALPALKAVE